METITKKVLVDRIAERTGLKRTVVKAALQEFLDEIVRELATGNRLEFRDFGVFEVKERAARVAQNPRTLEPVPVPARRSVKFKVGRRMQDLVEGLAVAAAADDAEDGIAGDGADAVRDGKTGSGPRSNGSVELKLTGRARDAGRAVAPAAANVRPRPRATGALAAEA